MEQAIVAVLGSDEARPFIDQAIPTALTSTKQDVLDDLGPLRVGDNVTPRSISSYENMLASLGNTLGPIAERAKKSVGSEIGIHADKAGPYLTKLIISIYQRLNMSAKSALVGVSTSAAVEVTHIEILAKSSPQLGAIVAVLTYIALSYLEKDKSKI